MRQIAIFLCLFGLGAAQMPSESLQRLIEGNQRYVNDELAHPDRSSDRREEIAEKQKPFAVIVGCSDSRVAPEIIFDQGLGDLFIVRVAGNVVGPIELASIEYAVKHLGASLVLVMGHEACGAVSAVVNGQTAGIKAIAELIQPAIKKSDGVEAAIKDNVQWVVRSLKANPLFKKTDCVGSYYHLGSGQVEILK